MSGFTQVTASGDYSLVTVRGLPIAVASLMEHRLYGRESRVSCFSNIAFCITVVLSVFFPVIMNGICEHLCPDRSSRL